MDAFDAMTSTRSYMPARTTDEALAELQKCSGTQFDPAVVVALADAVRAAVDAPREAEVAADRATPVA